MVEMVWSNGGEAWYLFAGDEGHGFQKETNRDYYRSVVATFLERHLIGNSPRWSAGRRCARNL